MNRLVCNLQLLRKLEELIINNPDLRFSQILRNGGFVQEVRPIRPEAGLDWQNDFYLESEVLLGRVAARSLAKGADHETM